MSDGSRWSPATTSKAAEGPIPAGFQAAVDKQVDKKIESDMANVGLQQKSSNSSGNNSTGGGGGHGNRSRKSKSKEKCNNCEKLDHYACECMSSHSSGSSESTQASVAFKHPCGYVEPTAE